MGSATSFENRIDPEAVAGLEVYRARGFAAGDLRDDTITDGRSALVGLMAASADQVGCVVVFTVPGRTDGRGGRRLPGGPSAP